MRSGTIAWEAGGVERAIEVRDGRARTVRVVHRGRPLLAPGWDAVAQGWRLALDGRVWTATSSDVELVGVETPAEDVRVLRHRAPGGVEVELWIRSFEDAPAELRWLAVRNGGTRALRVADVQSLELPLVPGPLERVELHRDFCSTRAHGDWYGGSDDPALRLEDAATGHTLFLLNTGPGLVRRSIGLLAYTPISTLGYDTARFPVDVVLAPGERFVADPVGWLSCEGDAHAALRDFAARHLVGRRLARPPIVYNTWIPFQLALDEALLLDAVDRAADIGFEVFAVDDGWQERQGLWREHPTKLPRGLEPVVARAHERGMRFGLWMGLATQHPEADVVRAYPEWLARERDGSVRTTATMQGTVPFCCLATGYADWIAETFARVLARLDVAYVKVDLTTVVQIYGERAGCFARDHGHDSDGGFALAVYRAIERITARWRRERPDLLVDLTYELWGAHHAVDYALLRAGDLAWLSNVLDGAGLGAARAARWLAYQRGRCVPPEHLLVGNLRADGPDPLAAALTSLASCPLLLGDLRAVDAASAAVVRRVFAAYRRVRDAGGVACFVPHEPPSERGTLAWDGFYRGDERGNGLVALFRNQSGSDRPALPLPAAARGAFTVRDVLGGGGWRADAGALRAGGGIALPTDADCVLLSVGREAGDGS